MRHFIKLLGSIILFSFYLSYGQDTNENLKNQDLIKKEKINDTVHPKNREKNYIKNP